MLIILIIYYTIKYFNTYQNFNLKHITLNNYIHNKIIYTIYLYLYKKTFHTQKKLLKIIIFFLNKKNLYY